MPRRGENIRKRKDGRWEGRIIIGHDLSGKAQYRSVYGHSYQEVKEKKKLLALAIRNEEHCSSGYSQEHLRLTFAQVMEEWLDSRKDSIKVSTYTQYSFMLNKYILPGLGEQPLSSLSSDILNAFLKNQLHSGRADGKGGLSPKTVADIRAILLQGISYAKERKYPCAVDTKVFYPKIRQPNIDVLTKAEQNKLEQVLSQASDPIRFGIMLALYGGLRIGEVCALQWGDFNYTAGTVRISKTLMRIKDLTPNSIKKTKIIIDKPKTEYSNRIIPLPSFLMELMRREAKGETCYVLTGTAEYVEPRLCLKQYKQVLEQAGLPSFTFHALRHTFATRCVESGFDIKALSEILGHSNVSTTLQRYVHPSIECKREQMERLERISIWGQNNGTENPKIADNLRTAASDTI